VRSNTTAFICLLHSLAADRVGSPAVRPIWNITRFAGDQHQPPAGAGGDRGDGFSGAASSAHFQAAARGGSVPSGSAGRWRKNAYPSASSITTCSPSTEVVMHVWLRLKQLPR